MLGPDPADALRRLEDLGVARALIPPPTYDPSQIGPALAVFTTSFAVKAA